VQMPHCTPPGYATELFLAWASADFFFWGKIFSRGTYHLPKNILFSFEKVKKHCLLAGQGGGGQVPPLALPCGRPWFLT